MRHTEMDQMKHLSASVGKMKQLWHASRSGIFCLISRTVLQGDTMLLRKTGPASAWRMMLSQLWIRLPLHGKAERSVFLPAPEHCHLPRGVRPSAAPV